MIYVALAELVVIALLVIALWRATVWFTASTERREQLHREERFELQERIRRPDAMPPRPRRRGSGGDDAHTAPKDLEEYARVGTVRPPADDPEGGVAS